MTSIFSQIKAEKKVQLHPGSTTKDMFDYIKPLLKKPPGIVILYIGISDAVTNPSEIVSDNTVSLKHFCEKSLPNARVCVYNLIIRTDDVKVTFTISKASHHLSVL